MKLYLVLIQQGTCVREEPLWLWFVFKTSQYAEKSSIRLDPKSYQCVQKSEVATHNARMSNLGPRALHQTPVYRCHPSDEGSQASMLSKWPALAKRVAEPTSVLMGQQGGTSIPQDWWCSWARRCFSGFSFKKMNRGPGGDGQSCLRKRQEGEILFPHLPGRDQMHTNQEVQTGCEWWHMQVCLTLS